MNSEKKSNKGFDLLSIKPVKKLILWSGFPYIFQVLTLFIFVILATIDWNLFAPEAVDDKLYAKTNIVNLLIWGLWWPAMVWVAVFLGRIWCMICPLELVSNFSERLGKRMGIKQRILGKWLRSGALILGLYALIQMLVAGMHLHRVPAYTSIFLWGLLAAAAIVGLYFKDRAFCSGFCPLDLLLNAYGRGGMLAVRVNSKKTCVDCTGKNCLRASNRTKLDARSCPSLLNPSKLNSNKDCLVCVQCIKACQPDNMQLVIRRPFHPSDSRETQTSWPLTLFVILVSGFVTYELTTEWTAAKSVFLWIPTQITDLIGLSSLGGWIKGVWTLFIFPLFLWLIMGFTMVALKAAANIYEAWRRLALPVTVIIAAGHMAKGIAKFVSWFGFSPYALKDPIGINTVLGINTNNIAKPASLLSKPVVSVISLILIIFGFIFAIREFRLTHPSVNNRWIVPKFAIFILFVVLVFGWRF